MGVSIRTLWTPGTRGTPFGIYELRLENVPYPSNGFAGFQYLQHAPILVIADTGSQPGLIYRYDYTANRIRIYQFSSKDDTVYETPPAQILNLTVRFFVVYDFVGNAP